MNTGQEIHTEIPMPLYEELLRRVDSEDISLEDILIRAIQNLLHKE